MDWIFSHACRYARSSKVSPKVDIYAFGVVLYELISAKKAIVEMSGSDAEPKGLVALVRVSCLSFVLFIRTSKNIYH